MLYMTHQAPSKNYMSERREEGRGRIYTFCNRLTRAASLAAGVSARPFSEEVLVSGCSVELGDGDDPFYIVLLEKINAWY